MIILLDNGSKRPEATKNLRRLAAGMTRRHGEAVQPVSLLHSSSIPPEQLDGRPAETLEPFLSRQIELGVRHFVIAPLFFGPSRAVDVFLPEIAARLEATAGPFDLRVAPVLCPLPMGEPRLVDILEANVRATMQAGRKSPNRILLVDHGSPVPAVTAVRQWLADQLAQRFTGLAPVMQAVMERRAGRAYDFNGELLGDILAATTRNGELTILAMQFISPGRHAGAGGDIERIAREAVDSHPGARVVMSPLIGEHPLLEEILSERIIAARGGG